MRAQAVDEDDGRWRFAVDQLRTRTRRLTGNAVELVEVSEADAARLLRGRKPLWLDVQREGVVVFGAAIAELTGRRSAYAGASHASTTKPHDQPIDMITA